VGKWEWELRTTGTGGRPSARKLVIAIISFMAATFGTPVVDITAKVDRSEITIGDRIQYEIDITYPSTGHVELPAVLGNLGAFEVKEYKTENNKMQDGRTLTKHLFTISTFTVGPYTLPPQRVEYREGTDTATLALYTQPTEIKVKRTAPENVKDIADIADVADLLEPPPWCLIGVGVLLAGLAGYFLWRKLNPKQATVGDAPRLPPYEEVLKRLTDLRTADLPKNNQLREFAFALSEVLRNYVGRRFGIEALESTTVEFLEKAATLPLTQAQQEWLHIFCDALDPLKYATAGIASSEAERLMNELQEFAEQTKPRPEPEQGK